MILDYFHHFFPLRTQSLGTNLLSRISPHNWTAKFSSMGWLLDEVFLDLRVRVLPDCMEIFTTITCPLPRYSIQATNVQTNTSTTVTSTGLEVKADLNYLELVVIVDHTSSLTLSHGQAHLLSADPRLDFFCVSLLAYRFCKMLLALLCRCTNFDRGHKFRWSDVERSQRKVSPTTRVPRTMFPRVFAYWFAPRILWTAALCFARGEHV